MHSSATPDTTSRPQQPLLDTAGRRRSVAATSVLALTAALLLGALPTTVHAHAEPVTTADAQATAVTDDIPLCC